LEHPEEVPPLMNSSSAQASQKVKHSFVPFTVDPEIPGRQDESMLWQRRIGNERAMYHVLVREDPSEAIFPNYVDRHDFLNTLADAGKRNDFAVHGRFLMKTNFHETGRI
jgi:hypothetical protein